MCQHPPGCQGPQQECHCLVKGEHHTDSLNACKSMFSVLQTTELSHDHDQFAKTRTGTSRSHRVKMEMTEEGNWIRAVD